MTMVIPLPLIIGPETSPPAGPTPAPGLAERLAAAEQRIALLEGRVAMLGEHLMGLDVDGLTETLLALLKRLEDSGRQTPQRG